MDDDMGEYKYIPLGDNVEEMFIGPFGSSLKNECFVEEDEAYCMVYEQKHAIQKTMDVETRYVNEQKYNELKRFNVHGGDIIVSCRGTIGETFIVPDDAPIGIMHPSIMKIRLKEGVYDKYYFNLLLKSRLKKHEVEANGSGIKMAISATELGKELFPVPTMEEQLEITDIISRTSCVIEKRKQELSALDDLIKARFVELFGDPSTNPKGYPVKVLPEIAEYWNGLTYKPEDVADEGTIVLRSSNIQNATLDFADTVRVSCKIGDKKYVQDNDILMCSRNGSARLVGKVALIKDIEEPMSFGAFMMIIRSDYYPYLMTYFQMPAFRAQITTGATTTINQITGRMLDIVKLPVPDIDVINEFADFVRQVDKSKFAVQKSLEQTNILFESLMQKYFG